MPPENRSAWLLVTASLAFIVGCTDAKQPITGPSPHVLHIDEAGAVELTTLGSARLVGTSVEQGGRRFALPVATEHRDHLERRGAAATEELVPNGSSIEQRWRFEQAPARFGDLLIRVEVAGLAFERASANALTFRARNGGRLRYADASWVDADGHRADVELSWTGQEIIIRVPETVMATSRFPAVLDPTLSAELDTDTPVPLATISIGTRAAFDGTNYFAVWALQGGIFGSFVTPQGTTSPSLGMQVSPSGGAPADVAYGAGEYLVVWYDGSHVRAARVGTVGQLLDATSIDVMNIGFCTDLSVTYGGNVFVVTAQSQGGVVAARVSSGGSSLDATPIVLASPSVAVQSIGAAGNANGFLVTWAGTSTASVLSLDVNGQPTSTGPVAIPAVGVAQRSAVATNGTDYVVIWSDHSASSGLTENLSARFDGTFHTVNTIGGALGLDGALLAYDGTEYLASWPDTATGMTGQRLDLNGAPLSLSSFATGIPAPPSDFVCGTTECVALTTVGTFVRVDHQLQPVDTMPIPIVQLENAQTHPDVAFGADQFLAVWLDARTSSVRGTRVNDAGTPLDDPSIAIAPILTQGMSDFRPMVSFDGSNFVVAWSDSNGDCQVARVSSAGQVLDSPPLTLGSDNAYALGSSTTQALVARFEPPSLYAQRIANDGGLLDPVGVVINGSTHVGNVAVASDGVSFLVVWESDNELRAARVAADGTLLDSIPFDIISAGSPNVAFDGTNYEVSGSHQTTQVVSRVSTAGVVLDTGGFDATASASVSGASALNTQAHATSFDGTELLLAETFTPTFGPRVGVLAVERVSPQGSATATALFPSSASGNSIGATAIASTPAGLSLIAYEHADSTHSNTPSRVYLRLYDRSPTGLGVACEVASDCISGFCVDQVCCDNACGGGPNDCQACAVAAGAPTDGICAPSRPTTVCRPPVDQCDAPELCDGTTIVCPPDVLVDAGVVCRQVHGLCDAPELCDGVLAYCPEDVAAIGAPCDDGNPCTGFDVCIDFQFCAGAPLDAGTPCDDGNLCSGASACDTAQSCVGSNWVTCLAADDCHVAGYCDPADGGCSVDTATDGTACDGGACLSGACVASPDAGTPDAGSPDAGTVDAGEDSGIATDSGVDSGTDASIADAGGPPDSGTPDSGSMMMSDGGSILPPPSQGCGCNSGSSVVALALLALVLRNRHARRRP